MRAGGLLVCVSLFVLVRAVHFAAPTKVTVCHSAPRKNRQKCLVCVSVCVCVCAAEISARYHSRLFSWSLFYTRKLRSETENLTPILTLSSSHPQPVFSPPLPPGVIQSNVRQKRVKSLACKRLALLQSRPSTVFACKT